MVKAFGAIFPCYLTTNAKRTSDPQTLVRSFHCRVHIMNGCPYISGVKREKMIL